MNEADRDYLIRLIEGVREQVKKSYCWSGGEITIPAKWIDASILCDVVEREILNNRIGGES